MTTPISGEAIAAGLEAAPQIAKLKEASKQVEAIFLKDLLSQLQKQSGKGGLFGKTPGADIYQDMMNQAIADSASKAGSFGIAQSLERQFRKDVLGAAAAKIKLASRAKAGSAKAHFDISG